MPTRQTRTRSSTANSSRRTVRRTRPRAGRRSRSGQAGLSARQQLLLVAAVPVLIGLGLIGASALDFTVWSTPDRQAVLGALFLMLGFGMLNFFQGRQTVAGGWLLLGTAVGAWLYLPESQRRTATLALAGLGAALIAWEYTRRLRGSRS